MESRVLPFSLVIASAIVFCTAFRCNKEEIENTAWMHTYFSFINNSENTQIDITACKPDPQGINMALDKLNMQRSQAIYIGDSIYDAGAAQNAGISFAAVLTGTTDSQQFSAYPSVQMMSALSELK